MRPKNHSKPILALVIGGLLLLFASTTGVFAQVVSNSNQVVGELEFTNANPEILSRINITRVDLRATSIGTPSSLTSYSSAQIVTQELASYELTVEAGPAGAGIPYNLYFTTVRVPHVYNIPSLTTAPVEEEPAPDVVADVSQCLAMARVTTVDADTGDPVSVYRHYLRNYSNQGTPQSYQSSYINQYNTSQSTLLVPDTDELARLHVTVFYRSVASLPYLSVSATFDYTPDCDQIYDFVIQVPKDLRDPIPPPETGTLTGRLDFVGEEIHRSHMYPGASYHNTTFPATWSYSGIAGSRHRIYGYDLRSGRYDDYQQLLYSPYDYIETIEAGVTIDVGDAFVMTPAILSADVNLLGPPDDAGPAGSCLGDLYRVTDDDSDGDGIPNSSWLPNGSYIATLGTNIKAPGATYGSSGGQVWKAFSGPYDPSLGEFNGTLDMKVGGPFDDDYYWRTWRSNYRFLETSNPLPGSYLNNTYYVDDDGLPSVLGQPGQTTIAPDIRHCFSEVRIHFLSLATQIYNPRLTGSGIFDDIDFTGEPANYRIQSVNNYGEPTAIGNAASEGVVRNCLPQGDYTFTPRLNAVNPGGGTSQQVLDPIAVTVGCRQSIDIRPELQITLDEVPRCVGQPDLTINGAVTGTFEVDTIQATLDGNAATYCDGNCGFDPTYTFDMVLEPCSNEVVVTAVDVLGNDASVATTSSLDTAAPIVTGCQDITVSVQPTVPGTPVSISGLSGVDACDGNRPVICDPPSGSVFPVGETAVTCTAADQCGYTDSCNLTVTVIEQPIETDNELCTYDDYEDEEVTPAWTLDDLGDGTGAAVAEGGGRLELTGDGSSLYHLDDNGAFLHRPATGDFWAQIDLEELVADGGGTFRKAGFMVRSGLEPDAARVMITYMPQSPDQGLPAVQFDVRGADGAVPTALGSTVQPVQLGPNPVRFAIHRQGDTFTVYVASEGGVWTRPSGALGGQVTVPAMGESPLVGPVVSSNAVGSTVTFAFDGFRLCRPNLEDPIRGGTCDERPVDLIHLLDLSGSMDRPMADGSTKLDGVKAAIQRIDQSMGVRTDGSRGALVTFAASVLPYDFPTVEAVEEQGLTGDFSAVDLALDNLEELGSEDATPSADGLRRARELFEASLDPTHRPVLIWTTDGLPTVDGSGNGSLFYQEAEVGAIEIRNPDDTFRSRGVVADSGNFNPLIGTHDGEALADAMAELEALQEAFPDLQVFVLSPREAGEPAFDDLVEYAAYLSGGAARFGNTGAELDLRALETLSSISCGAPGLGTLGGQLWDDVDGDGNRIAGEALLDGVTVRLLDGVGTQVAAQVTVGGRYLFLDVTPGDYTLEVDTTTLPVSLDQATADPDGTATPDRADVSVAGWDVFVDLDFGYRQSSTTVTGCITDDFTDLGSAWSVASLGDADQVSAASVGGELHLAGDGVSLYAGADHGGFVYRPVSGDFRAEVDITGFPVNTGGPYRKAGLMVRTGLGSLDARLMAQFVPNWNNGSSTVLQFRARTTAGGPGDVALGSNAFDIAGLPTRFAIERQGDTFVVEFSTDGGATWQSPAGGSLGTLTVSWPDEVLLGMDVVSYSATVATTAAFDDFQVCEPGVEP